MGRKNGTRARRSRRIAESSRLGWFIDECRAVEESRDHFRRNWSGGFGYRSEEVKYIATSLGTYRDASPREESNWSVIEPAMEAADSFGHVSEHPGVIFHREGSALCGWIKNVYVRVDDAVALRTAMDFVSALANYPILDEEDCSRREWESDHSDENTCYAEEGCGCDVATHDCVEWFKSVITNPEDVEDVSLFEIDTEKSAYYCAGPGCQNWRDMTAELWYFYRAARPGPGQLLLPDGDQ